jgi:hypothetical protein
MWTSFGARALGLELSAEATIDLAATAGFAAVDLLVRDALLSGSAVRALRCRLDD